LKFLNSKGCETIRPNRNRVTSIALARLVCWVKEFGSFQLETVNRLDQKLKLTILIRKSWRKRVGVEPTIRSAKDRIDGFEGREDHRTLFASVLRNPS
jgi:hypothetical protein